jgi:hypothetical protein
MGEALLWNRAAALAGTLFLFLLARALLVRTERDAAASADRLHPGRSLVLRCGSFLFLLLPLLIQGFLAIEIRQGAEGAPEIARAADYFRLYRRGLESLRAAARSPASTCTSTSSRPSAGWRSAGSYELENATAAPMARLPFTVGSSFGPVSWSLAGAALEVEEPVRSRRAHPRAAARAGRVGCDVDFSYAATYPRGFSRNGGGAGTFILPAGVLLSTHRGEFC